MPTSRRQSGFFIQASNPRDKYEMVLPISDWRLRHFGNDRSLCDDSAWYSTDDFGNRGVFHDNASLIQSSFGHLEVVAQTTSGLAHYWKSLFGWSSATYFGSNIAGNPAFIQSSYGRNGNFEVVVPRQGGGLSHYWRDNDPLFTAPWSHSTDFGSGNIGSVAMIQSSYFGNLEVVARDWDNLVFYWRGANGWSGPFQIARRVQGQPGFIQSSFGRIGNFEVVIPQVDGGLAHYWRDNNDPNLPWYGPFRFGGSGAYSKASLIQASDGLLIVFAQPYGRNDQIAIFQRMSGPPWTWSESCVVNLVPTISTPPLVPATHFDFILAGNWMNFITPTPGEVYIAVAPPGTDISSARHYPMTQGLGNWTTSVPLSDGRLGIWTFQCHVRGVFGDGTDTGDINSDVYTYDWQVRNPAAYIYLNSEDTHDTSWSCNILNS